MNPLKFFVPVVLLLPLVTNGNDAPEKVVVCIFSESTEYRNATFTPEDIDPAICTHIIHKGVRIDSESLQLKAEYPKIDFDDNVGEGYYNRTMKLKEQNPNLKILLQVCCLRNFFWDKALRAFHSDPINSTTISNFAEIVVKYVQTHGFDGINIPWHDNDNMAPLMTKLRTEFDKHGLILTTFLSQISDEKQDKYRLPTAIAGLVDLMMLGTYWNDDNGNYTQFISSTTAMKKYVSAYLEQGFPPEKLVVSIPTITVTVELCDGNETGIGTPICFFKDGQDEPNMEILGYYEIMERLKDASEEWVHERDEETRMPYAHSKSHIWIGYEDTVSVRAKAEYVLEKNIAGVALMTIDTDDFKGNNEEGIKFPLTRAAYNLLNGN